MKLTNSLLGLEWKVKEHDEDIKFLLEKEYGLPQFVARTIASRVKEHGHVDNYLNPKLRNLFPDPFILKDMDKAADRLIAAIEAMAGQESIAIFGDYDVDGATSTAMLINFLKQMGITAQAYIPDRIREGYGPNIEAMKNLHERGVSLIITVDCGSVAFEPLAEAAKLGMDVIVIDHHKCLDEVPQSVAVVNPNRCDENSEYGYLAGAGVTLLLIAAVAKKMKEKGRGDVPSPMNFIDLAAVGTICDVVPLVGLNRAIVKTGIEMAKVTQNIGLKALYKICQILPENLNGESFGFSIGPCINAAGRIDNSILGVSALTCEDQTEAENIALRLVEINEKRKLMEKDITSEAIGRIDLENLLMDSLVVCLSDQKWHQGVIGITAGRIKGIYNRPSIIISEDQEGEIAKASCRSIRGFDIGGVVSGYVEQGILEKGGGHAMAAGFSVKKDNIVKLKMALARDFPVKKDAELKANLEIDSMIPSEFFEDSSSIEALSVLEPYGNSNEKPIFLISRLRLIKIYPLGQTEAHHKFVFKEEDSENFINAVMFNTSYHDNVKKLIKDFNNNYISHKNSFSIAATLSKSTYKVGTIDIHILDIGSSVIG